MEKCITHASLFSGIGAPELAAVWMGWQNLFHCEINEFCNTVLNYWFPESKAYEDITTTDFSEWRGRVDVLTGGFPCQPFSSAGQRRGADDDRYLWPQMLRAIRQIQPTFVIGENVAGILSMVQPGSEVKVDRKTSLFDEDNNLYERRQQFVVETVCSDLEAEGYSVQPFVIPACAVGAPHRRDRVWFLAKRRVPTSADDTHDTGVLRESRVDEGESRPQRLQERNEIQQSAVASHLFRPTADTSHAGTEGLREWQAEVSFSGASPDSIGCGHTASPADRETESERRSDNGKQSEWGTAPQWADGLPPFLWADTNPQCIGCDRWISHRRERPHSHDTERCSEEGDTQDQFQPRTGSLCTAPSDSQCSGGDERGDNIQPPESDGQRTHGYGSQWYAPDTMCTGFQEEGCELPPSGLAGDVPLAADPIGIRRTAQRDDNGPSEGTQETQCGAEQPFGADCPQSWWWEFPTVSPVCRGNDGLSFDVSRLTIPFTTWRRESIKALGNSMVPQVVLELFRAIEKEICCRL